MNTLPGISQEKISRKIEKAGFFENVIAA